MSYAWAPRCVGDVPAAGGDDDDGEEGYDGDDGDNHDGCDHDDDGDGETVLMLTTMTTTMGWR